MGLDLWTKKFWSEKIIFVMCTKNELLCHTLRVIFSENYKIIILHIS